jgi:hypothetical protein
MIHTSNERPSGDITAGNIEVIQTFEQSKRCGKKFGVAATDNH